MKRLIVVLSVLAAFSMLLSACGGAAKTEAPVATAAPTEAPVATEVATAAATATEAVCAAAAEAPVPDYSGAAAIAAALPRNETLYTVGQQWSAVVGWNPYSSNNNNAMAFAQQDNARVIMFETPYLYNMLDGKQYPLLADGPFAWDEGMTKITFKLKAAAKWSDGTPVTADDVAYTWASHVKYKTQFGVANSAYIKDIVAVDPQTVEVQAVLGEDGKTLNPLLVQAYLSTNYVAQKAWTQKLEARTCGDPALFMADIAADVPFSGPYGAFFSDDTKIVYGRNDSYWGQDASMWGKLPAPKYLAHLIYKDNAAATTALQAGEADVAQLFISNVQDLWLEQGLPISTYLPEAPYGIGASIPTAWFNMASFGLDNVAVRKAIAMAVDYDNINANAMTGQSASFKDIPRSLMNPTAGEQAMYDHAAVADLQWAGNDIEGANKLLDDAGIKDTDGDGFRDIDGKKLSYTATCPNGWSDWMASMETVAAAGAKIGIEIVTAYPEWGVYQTVFTNWPLPATGYDIFMWGLNGAGPTQPWGRVRQAMSSEFAGTTNNWNGNYGNYVNPAADAIINAIPAMTDAAEIKAAYTELTKIYLTDVPSFALMYRPQNFHTVNESVWTNFPHQGDGTDPVVPPLNLTDGWSIAGLYNLTLVNP